MLDPSKIDIDRLHRVAEYILANKITQLPHHEGCTTAFLYLMLGEIWTHNPGQHYVYVGKVPHTVFLDFVGILVQEEVEITSLYSIPAPMILLPTKQTFKFVDIQQVCNEVFWKGTTYNKIFFDEDLYSISSEQRGILLREVHCSGAILI